MYTIVLARLRNAALFKQYQFVFLNAGGKEEIGLCFWDKEGKPGGAEAVIQELNTRIRERSEWKLIVYDECYEGEVANQEMEKVLKLFSGRIPSESGQHKVESSYPIQLFYIRNTEKTHTPLREDSCFCMADTEHKFGSNVRMFLFETESGNQWIQSFNEFKTCCALASLALGEIPYTFMDAGYLYKLDIEIDIEKVGEYIAALDDRFLQIEDQYESEWEDLKRRRKESADLPDINPVKLSVPAEKEDPDTAGVKILKFWEAPKLYHLDRILKKNREFLERQMFYPRGLLHEVSKRVRSVAGEQRAASGFLSEMGWEKLERKVRETLYEMCEKKDAQFKQTEFEEEIFQAECEIRKQAMRWIEKERRRKILFFFGIAELFVLEPYAMNYVLSEEGKRLPLPGVWIYAVVCVAAFAIVYAGYYLYLWRCHQKSWGVYKKKIFGRLSSYRRDKKRYLDEILNLLVRFQCLENISRDQGRLSLQWEQDRKMLESHRRMLDNGMISINPFKGILGKDKQDGYERIEAPQIDFLREPREEEYYGLSFRSKNGRTELNYSGYKIRPAFSFITRLLLKKAVCSERGDTGEDGNGNHVLDDSGG